MDNIFIFVAIIYYVIGVISIIFTVRQDVDIYLGSFLAIIFFCWVLWPLLFVDYLLIFISSPLIIKRKENERS